MHISAEWKIFSEIGRQRLGLLEILSISPWLVGVIRTLSISSWLVEVIKRETISFLCTCEGSSKNWSFYSQADRKDWHLLLHLNVSFSWLFFVLLALDYDYVFWNGFYTIKKSFSFNFKNPLFPLLNAAALSQNGRIAV